VARVVVLMQRIVSHRSQIVNGAKSHCKNLRFYPEKMEELLEGTEERREKQLADI
jgi:hypothetical protein